MKKVLSFVLICNILFFSVSTYIEYAGKNYENIHDNKVAIEITKPENMTVNEFVFKINKISKQTGIDCYYETIENSTSGHPKYVIYKTNTTLDFFQIKINGKDNILLKYDEILSTQKVTNSNSNLIIGSSLLNDIEIHSIEAFNNKHYKKGLFYTNSEDARLFAESLSKSGIASSLSRTIPFNSKISSFLTNQIFLVIMLIVTLLFYFFDRKKEFTIKKVNGYSDFTLFIEEVTKLTAKSIFIIAVSFVCIVIVLIIKNINSIFDFLLFSVPFILIAILTIVLASAITGLYIFSSINAKDINGKSKHKDIAILSFASKGLILVFCTLKIVSFVSCINQYSNLSNTLNTNIQQLSKKYYMPFNAISVDIDSHIDEYSQNSSTLYNDIINIIGSDNIFVIDAGNYDEQKNSESDFVLLNKTYLKQYPIKNEDGSVIDIDSLNKDKEHIFVPIKNITADKKAKDFAESIEDTGNNVEIHYYNSKDYNMFTFRPNCGDNHGYIQNPIIYLPLESNIMNNALGLMSNCNLLICNQSENPYELIYPFLVKNNLTDVVVECVEASDYYNSNLLALKIQALQALYMIISTLTLYIVASVFYITVYFQNNKKKIAVKLINGYGINTFSDYFIFLFILQSACSLIALIITGTIIYSLLAVLIDLFLTLIVYLNWSKKNLVLVLKGE